VTTALYRRFRPETFAEMIGQEHVTEPLSQALRADRVNHAYLFSGPRGCGKTTSARILARCLNCEQGPTPTPCGTCPSCVELARGGPGSLDVVEIDAASHGGVDDARDLRERAIFAPVRDRYKVFIIDEAHMVSPQGFNALLKIVEEPPEHIRFIFATTEPDKVIGTIRSRTHHYPFRLVPPERLQDYLAELCEREGVAVGSGVLPLVVRAGAGSVRDSLSVLDQLIAGAGPEGLSYATAVALLGYTDATLLDDVVEGLSAGDGAAVFTVVDRVVGSGHDPRRFVEDLLERLRDLLILEAVRDAAHAVFRGVPADQLSRMQAQAARFGAAELSRSADVANAALTEMTGATSPRLQLELLVARLLLPAADDEERGVRARVDRLEKRVGMAGPATGAGTAATAEPAPAPRPAPRVVQEPGPAPVDPRTPEAAPDDRPRPEVTAPAPAHVTPPATATPPAPAAAATPAPASAPAPAPAPAPAGTPDVEQIRRMWPEVLSTLSGIKRATWSLLSPHAQVLEFTDGRLVLGFAQPKLATSFARGSHQEFLRQALIQVMGLDCKIEAVAGDRPAPAPRRPAAAPEPAPTPTPATSIPATARPAPASAPAAGASPAAAPARPAAGDPYGDVPPDLAEPPPADDEVPPDDGRPARRPAGGPAPASARPASQPAPQSAPQSAPRPARPRTATAPPPAPAPPPTPAPRATATRGVVDLSGDEPSVDDADVEGSHLVGASVVEQLLGGRVIEEREE